MQFSLKAIMFATSAVAVLCALFASGGFGLPILFCLQFLLAPVITIGVIYGRGNQQTFAIGAAASYVAEILNDRMFNLGILNFVLIFVSGYLAIGVRRLLENSQKPPIVKPPGR